MIDKGVAVIFHYGSGVIDFYVDKDGKLVWNDVNTAEPTSDDIASWWGEYLSNKEQSKINDECLDFLNATDWIVTRHRDQIDMGIQTSLSDEEYNAVLLERQEKRDSIVR